jgi:hypothetical protein
LKNAILFLKISEKIEDTFLALYSYFYKNKPFRCFAHIVRPYRDVIKSGRVGFAHVVLIVDANHSK